MDRVANLKYLKVVLKKFNIIATFNNNILICYFQDKLNLSIKAN